jgi:hypothetical protein
VRLHRTQGIDRMNDFRQTPHKDFVRVPTSQKFAGGDRWSGTTIKAKSRWSMFATWLALTAGIGMLALAD